MTQGRFNKEEAASVIKATEDIMKAFPTSKVAEFVGHFNDLMLFLSAAKEAAPNKEKKE